MKQAERVKQITVKQLHLSLYLSQLLFLMIALMLSLFLFSGIADWTAQFTVDGKQIILLGVLPAIVLVMIELLCMRVLPKGSFDDGGINEKVFKGQAVWKIFLIALVVAITEELLFRGVLQTTFGLFIASSIFALVHVRYLSKPILFIAVVLISFLIGFVFEWTGNLFVVIAFHFSVDFLLGLYIKFQKTDEQTIEQ